MNVQDGDMLDQVTGRDVYKDCRIGEIRVAKGKEHLELRYSGGEIYLNLGDAYGDVGASAVQREIIRRTIKEHLDKEKRLRPQGIKVLSLFFIDSVEKYRQYDADGNQVKGEYAIIFEEEYRRWARHPDYQTLFKEVDLKTDAAGVHDGYFSIDKKGGWTDTEEGNQSGRDNAERAYLKSMVDANKSVYEKVIYQSDTERNFAEQLEQNEAIKVYAKLPGWFKVPTPLGTYNPDWAVLVHTDAGEQLYFVVETKHSLFTDDLRDRESGKIKCGEAHFAELANFNSPAAEFIKATKIGDLLARV